MTEVAQMENLRVSNRVVDVFYCGICSVPPEYCEYGSNFTKCQAWLKDNNQELYQSLYGSASEGETTATETKDTSSKPSKKKEAAKKTITITTIERTKRKRITQVRGLELFQIDLKKASKMFASKFAASASVSKYAGGEEILIQGECADDLLEYIVEQFGVSEDDIEFGETKKK